MFEFLKNLLKTSNDAQIKKLQKTVDQINALEGQTKKLTDVRAAGTDEKVMLPPPVRFSLEEALEYIQEDELVEVTPKSMRMRKIILDETERKRASRN